MNERPEIPSRRPRPEAPRGPAPGRREPTPDEVWELWNLRALRPGATADDLVAWKERRRRVLAREREALAGLWSGITDVLVPGHRFLADNPELRSGLVVSMHLGPYALVLEPYLAAGRSPRVLVTDEARRRNEPLTAKMATHLGHGADVTWLNLGDRRTLRRVLRALREDEVVVAYLDGNLGEDGFAGTRDQGLDFELPGRTIRLRTGLARLAVRTGAPIHPVCVYWDDDGQPVWRRGKTVYPERDDDPAELTRRLFTWCFDEIVARPEQWTFWAMLKESAACFATAATDGVTVPPALRRDYARAFGICLARSPQTARLRLERAVAVWPGEVLVDLEDDRFYDARGLQDEDLAPLRTGQPTLADLTEVHGEAWVRFHGLRLCLLGLARLCG